jgi:hypothetical protein
MDASSHIYTQGATVDLYMPQWAGAGKAKPLTLYKRMAYAASVNTYNNAKVAFKQGDMMKITFGTLGAYATGEMLMGVYDKVLGQAKPNQNSGWWDRFMMAMWKGEFLGIFSEWFNPDGESQFEHTITPALYNHATLMADVITSLDIPLIGKDTRTGKQAIDQFFRGSLSMYNQTMKIIERKMTPYNAGHKEAVMWGNEFMKEFNPESLTKESGDYKRTERSKFYQDLKTVWNQGKDEDVPRQYLTTWFALYTNYRRKGIKIDGTPTYSHAEGVKYANSTLKNYIKFLNPNRGSFIGDKELPTLKRSADFMKYLHPDRIFDPKNLSKNQKKIQSLERQYWKKHRQFFNENGELKSKYVKGFNLKELAADFDWK